MSSQSHFSPDFIEQLAKTYDLPMNQLQEALEEGERAWVRTKNDNQEDQEDWENTQKILEQIRDWKRGKQKTLNEEALKLIAWHQDTILGSNGKATVEEAIHSLNFLYSRSRGQRQVSIYIPDMDIEVLRKFSWPLRDLWTSLGRKWTVSKRYKKKKYKCSSAENFFFVCASRLEPEISEAQVRTVVMRPCPTKDEGVDDPSDYHNLVMVLTKQGRIIKQIR